MLRTSYFFESSRRESAEVNMESPRASYPPSPTAQSPQSAISSNPESPVVSLFSTRSHTRFPSSVSSLASSPGVGSSTEAFGSMKTPLTEVKEEPLERETSIFGADNYFPYFDQFYSVDHVDGETPLVLETRDYDLSDDVIEFASSPKKRRSDNTPFRGISRISTRFSSMSSKWRQKQSSETAAALERYDESLRSRTSSATSTLVSTTVCSLSRRQSRHCPSPARTVFEERLNEVTISPIDVDKANRDSVTDVEPQATTPLLPPLMMESLNKDIDSPFHSPLQSPSVADATDFPHVNTPTGVTRLGGLPSPPLSTQPSMSSLRRQLGAPRIPSTSDIPTMMLENDEWSRKLGHANFTIRPEPYLPEDCTIDALEAHRTNWELARCNYAKHLVRTGEHYGVTSIIYKLTEEKWDSVDGQWRENHERVIADLGECDGNASWMSNSKVHLGETIKIPRLHDKLKFPDLGDEDIVGPMAVGPTVQSPTPPQGKPLRKRTLFRFLQDLFSCEGKAQNRS